MLKEFFQSIIKMIINPSLTQKGKVQQIPTNSVWPAVFLQKWTMKGVAWAGTSGI